MGKTLIKVRCTDQELFILNAPVITSGGKNEDAIEFDFCPLWDDFEKFATFYRDRDTVYHVRIVDNRCIIPHEVLKDEGWVHFGVFGEKDGAIRTSSILKYHIEFGVPLEGIEPLEPTPDLWEQILATTVTAETVEGGHKVTIAVGGNSESFTVMNGRNGEDAPVPEIDVETVQGGHKVIAAVGDTVKSFIVKDGVDGKDGDDAPIPEIKVETISGGHKVTASVGNTVQSFNVMDGKDGKTPVKNVDYFDGKDGYSPVKNKDYFDGKDGISPVINVTDIENGHRVTITTGSDVQSFDVMNGKDGEGGSGGTVEVDPTLSIEGMAADAKATGDAIKAIGSGGGAQVQSDYNQHDATQPDYIRNRPFWPEWSPVLVSGKSRPGYFVDHPDYWHVTFDVEDVGGGFTAPNVGTRYTCYINDMQYSGIAVNSIDALGGYTFNGIRIDVGNDDIAIVYQNNIHVNNWVFIFPKSTLASSVLALFTVIEGDNPYNKLSVPDDVIALPGNPAGVYVVCDFTEKYKKLQAGDEKATDMFAALTGGFEIVVDMSGTEYTLTKNEVQYVENVELMGYTGNAYMYGGQAPLAALFYEPVFDKYLLALLDLNALGMAPITAKSIKINYPGIFAPTIPAKKIPEECMPDGVGGVTYYVSSTGDAYFYSDFKLTEKVTTTEFLAALARTSVSVALVYNGVIVARVTPIMCTVPYDYGYVVVITDISSGGEPSFSYYYTAEYTGS